MDPAVLDLPRSVQLALWLPGLHATSDDVGRAIDVVQDDDEPHTITPADDVALLPGTTMAELLNEWGRDVIEVAAVLPVPGDVAGVPAAVSSAAVDAGECVLVSTRAGSFAAVPQVEAFGSSADTGHTVDWQISQIPPWSLGLVGVVGSLPEAERDLRSALIIATDALDSLDVAQWRPDADDALTALRSTPWHVPPALDPRRSRVLSLAARLRVIIALAAADNGGAVNLWQADQRTAALRHIDRAARNAVCAATFVLASAPQA